MSHIDHPHDYRQALEAIEQRIPSAQFRAVWAVNAELLALYGDIGRQLQHSAELAAIASKLGKLPTVAEYQEAMGIINKDAADTYRYMNFDQIEEYAEVAKGVAV